MAQFCVQIADADAPDVIAALCTNYGYKPFDENGDPNRESPNQFANRMTRNFLIDHTTTYRKRKAISAVPNPDSPKINDPSVANSGQV